MRSSVILAALLLALLLGVADCLAHHVPPPPALGVPPRVCEQPTRRG